MATPLDIANELNKMILQQNQNLLKQAAIQRNQLSIMIKMAEVTEAMNPGTLSDGFASINEELQKIDENLEALGNSSQENMSRAAAGAEAAREKQEKLRTATEKYQKTLKVLGGALIVATSFFGGIAKAMRLVWSAGSGLLGILGSVASSLFNVGAAIISAPFKILGGLMEGAAQGGGSELRQALEDIRKEFGDLSKGSSKAIISMSKSMKGELANTGLSTFRIFGNLAEKLKTISEYAKQLGPLFTNLSGEMMKNAEAVGAYVKGLGLTEEGMRGVGARALATGKSFTEVGREITSFAFQMGDAFGINGKEISRDVATMMKDVKNFGNLSVKQLTQVTVYARKLGLEFKDMQGVIDKFDNFEDAAQGAAQLSQAFGMNVDALELVQEQDPAARFDKLRKAFYSTGKSVESMTRQELKLLAAQTGLSEEAVKLGFSQANQGIGYDEVQKKAGAAEKKQLSQAEAMEKLANSIERMVKSGGMQTKSFFEAFTNGFQDGIGRSKEFREMMRAIGQALRTIYRAGRELGRAFVEAFPGVKQLFGGIRDLFNPGRIKNLMSGVVDAFKKFFKDLSEGKGTALSDLMDNLKKKFFDFFDQSKGPGSKILDAIKMFGKALVTIIAGLIKKAMEGLTSIFKYLKDPSAAIAAAKEAGGEAGSSMMEILQPIFDSVAEAWPALKEAFLDLLHVAWENLKPKLAEIGKDILLGILGVGALTASMAGIGLLAAGLASSLKDKLLNKMAGSKGIVGTIGKLLGGEAEEDKKKKSKTPKPPTAGELLKQGAVNLGLMTGGVLAMALAYLAVDKIIPTGIKPERLAAIAAVLTLMGAAFTAIGGALGEMADTFKNQNWKNLAAKLGIALLAIGLGTVVMALAYLAIDKIIPDNVKAERVAEIAGVMGLMSLLFAVVALGLRGLAALKFTKEMAKEIATGLGVIALGILAMSATWALLYAGFKYFVDAKTADALNKSLETMVYVFGMTGLILIEAAGIGALILGTAGIAGGAMAAGLGAIATGVLTMGETAVGILAVINNLNLSEGIDQKIKVFTVVFQSVISFAQAIAEIIKAAQPSVLSSIFKTAEPVSKSLIAANILINSIGTQTTSIVNSITTAMSTITPEQLAKADKYSGVLVAVTGLVKSLMPAVSNVDVGVTESTAGTINSIMMTSSLVFSSNADAVKDKLAPAIKDLLGALKDLPNVNAGLVSAAFSGIGSIISIVPNILSVIANATKKSEEKSSRADPVAFTLFVSNLPKIFDSISKGMESFGPSMKKAIDAVIGTVKDLTEPQMKRAEVAFKLVGTLLYYSKEFISMGLKQTTATQTYTPSDGNVFSTTTSNLNQIFDDIIDGIGKLGESFPLLIKAVVGSFKGLRMGEIKDVKSKFTIFFEILDIAAKTATTLKDMGPVLNVINASGTSTADQMMSGGPAASGIITSVSDFILQISGPMNNLVNTIKTSFVSLKEGEYARVKYGFTQLFNVLNVVKDLSKPAEVNAGPALAENLAGDVDKVIKGIIAAAEKIKASKGSIETAMTGFDAKYLTGAVHSLDSVVTDQTSKTLTAVVDRLNRINRDLTSIAEAPTKLNVQLQKAADNLSLKGNGALTINKPDFTVNINVEVKLHADEFESTLISRPGKSKFVVKGA